MTKFAKFISVIYCDVHHRITNVCHNTLFNYLLLFKHATNNNISNNNFNNLALFKSQPYVKSVQNYHNNEFASSTLWSPLLYITIYKTYYAQNALIVCFACVSSCHHS